MMTAKLEKLETKSGESTRRKQERGRISQIGHTGNIYILVVYPARPAVVAQGDLAVLPFGHFRCLLNLDSANIFSISKNKINTK